MMDVIGRLNSALEGRYRIEREVGAGGTASVYLAHDLKHHRRVAIKVLQPHLAAMVGAERFLAEVETTANLQHPHILPLFDSGEADGLLFYVMPFVEGESVRDRLLREKQLPIAESVRIAVAVAGALEHAHRHGIIHRDIKPGNILLQDREPVVADFGIALAIGSVHASRLTETGLSLGTPHYMSPEQASGEHNIGPSTDIYSLACVLYELLTGAPPFVGATAQAILGQIIAAKLIPARESRPSIPVNVDAAIRQALEKLPSDRFETARDFARALEDEGFRYREPRQENAGGRKRLWVGIASTAAVLAMLGGFVIGRRLVPTVTSGPFAFTIALPEDAPLAPGGLSPLAISPNAEYIVHVGITETGTRLYKRARDDLAVVPIPGTDGALGPFFAPDGRWVGFFAGGRLKKVPIEGGQPFEIASAALARGATWARNDTIFYAAAPGTGIWAVHANGGSPRPVTTLDAARGERTHRLPQFLEHSRSIVATVREGRHSTFDEARIESFSIDEGRRTVLLDGGSAGQVLPDGRLLFLRGGALNVLDELGRPSTAVSLIDSVMYDPSTGAGHYAISADGMLVYVRGPPWVPERQVVVLDRRGTERQLSIPAGAYREPRFSSNGTAVALVTEAASDDIWIHDFRDGSSQRITFVGGSHVAPVWSPGDSLIVFSSNRAGDYNLYLRPVRGSGEVRRLTESDHIQIASSWHPDGNVIAFTQTDPRTGSDVWLAFADGRQPSPLLADDSYDELAAVFHPSLPWIAYVSDENGQEQVYIDQIPVGRNKRQVSMGGGTNPVWGATGDRLYYRRGLEVISHAVEPGRGFNVASTIRVELTLPPVAVNPRGSRDYDVTPNGQAIIAVQEREARHPAQIHVMLGFYELLERRMGRAR